MYLCIENSGEVDIRSLCIMGVSIKEKENDKAIGMFGTGAKYGIAALVRTLHEVTIYSGTKKIDVHTRKVNLRGVTFEEIIFRHGKKTYSTNMTQDLGKLSWTLNKGIIEIISNAYDEKDPRIYRAEKVVPESGKTIVAIKMSSSIESFCKMLPEYFLHQRSEDCVYQGEKFALYSRLKPEGVRVYRRGVLVYSNHELKSLYDYNLDRVEVGEDRTSSSWEVRWEFTRSLKYLPEAILSNIIKSIELSNRSSSEQYFEDSIEKGAFEVNAEVLRKIVGNRVVVSNEEYQVYRSLLARQELMILPRSWVDAMRSYEGISTLNDALNSVTLNGWVVEDPDSYEKDMISKIVETLSSCGYPITTSDIKIAQNIKPNAPMGQYIDGVIYVNRNSIRRGYDETLDTVTHELMHKLSGFTDTSLEFERYIIGELVHMIRKLSYEKSRRTQ